MTNTTNLDAFPAWDADPDTWPVVNTTSPEFDDTAGPLYFDKYGNCHQLTGFVEINPGVFVSARHLAL